MVTTFVNSSLKKHKKTKKQKQNKKNNKRETKKKLTTMFSGIPNGGLISKNSH